ncbi:MAG: type II secretion system F family protein [Sedimentisphaerales bacterium]|jgi:tight adherence protein B
MTLNIIILVTVFVLVFSLWCFCVFAWLGHYLSRLKNIQQRLGLITSGTVDESKMLRLWRDTQAGTQAGRVEVVLTLQKKLKRIANDAGWRVSINTVLFGLGGACFLTGIIAFVLTNSIVVAFASAMVTVSGFSVYTRRKIDKRADLFESQLIDALGIAARSLRAGHPLAGAFQLIAEEIGPPLGDVFYRICKEQELGVDMKNSIRSAAEETSNSELKFFTSAVAIQLQSGGNLADLMDSLSAVIRVRVRLARRVRVLTAQTNFSARILIAMPVILFILLNIVNPNYMAPMYKTTTGQYILAGTIVSVLLGWWLMKKLSVLRF